jgi:REP-associated tyrosine transposase
MPRSPRVQIAGGHFHVVARAVSGEPLFRDDTDRRRFVTSMNRIVIRLQWHVWAYCLMTTHYHLVAETRNPDLARGIQYVNGLYAQGFNRRWNRFGHLFAERYSSRLIESDAYLAEACSYVLDNPVRAGICDSPLRWPWSGGQVFEDMSEGLTPRRFAALG